MDDTAPLQSVVCPELIHRERELALVDHLMRDAAQGQMRVFLLAGEAGIGKSRLTAEIARRASQRGFQIRQTACVDYDRALPYAPLIDLLQALFALRPHDTIPLLGPAGTALAALLPALFPEQPAHVLDANLEKPLLFRALTAALSPTIDSPALPTLMVIEDLHWCDAATLEFVSAFVQRASAEPVLLVLNYRHDQISTELAHLLAALRRLRSMVFDHELARMNSGGVQRMIAAIFAQRRPLRLEFIAAIHGLADGNPFFVEEVLRSLIATGDIYQEHGVWTRKPIEQLRIPRSMREAVQVRTAALDSTQQRVLQLAAVLGRQFAFDLLCDISALAPPLVLAILKVLIGMQILLEEGSDHFAFRHALVREAIMAALLARERRPLHLAIAELLERQGSVRLGELAYHYYEAGLWEHAITYSRRAGDHALALFAAATAAEHFTRAIHAYAQLEQPAASVVLLARGQAYEHMGDTAAAQADYERACALARAADDSATETQALLALGFVWVGQDYPRAGMFLQSALERARTTADSTLVAQTLNRLGNWHLMTDDPARSIKYHNEALTIVTTLGDHRSMAATLDLLGIAYVLHGDMVAGARYYQQALEHWEQAHERQWRIPTLAAYATRGGNALFPTAACTSVSLAQCLNEAEAALALAREIGWQNGEATVLIWMSTLLAPRGEARHALECANMALQLAIELEHQLWINTAQAVIGATYLDLFAFETAQQAFEIALERGQRVGSSFVILTMSGYLALTLIGQQRHTEAEAILNKVSSTALPFQTQAQLTVWFARARLALVRHQPIEALEIADRMLQVINAPLPTDSVASEQRLAPQLWLLRGDALVANGDDQAGEVWLRAAADAGRHLVALPIIIASQAGLARLYHRHRRVDDEEQAVTTVRTALSASVARMPHDVCAGFLRHAQQLLPAARPTTALRAERQRYHGLTLREREVAMLITQGKSNRLIAATMTLSERTVEKHIEHVMGKLGVTTRTQIAVWVTEHGLIEHA